MEKIKTELKSYETIGYIAGLLTTSSFIPQVFKSYQIMKNNLSNNQKIKSEISLYFIFIISIGMILWVIYGITIYIRAKKEKKKHTVVYLLFYGMGYLYYLHY